MKRLANLKNSSADVGQQDISAKRSTLQMGSKGKKNNVTKNHPYQMSRPRASAEALSTPLSVSESGFNSPTRSKESLHNPAREDGGTGANMSSRPPTLSTTAETTLSDAGASKAGTSATAARTDGGRNSTFSSPAPSLRSMTTTLTTVQSATGTGQPNTASLPNGHQTSANTSIHTSSHFSHPFSSTSPGATNPSTHNGPHSHHTTYTTATANNVLTDDASILTLASSSKRRRRNSLDTNASMRALAPASMFGGSRESLPLSVLSGIVDTSTGAGSVTNAPGVLPRPSIGGIASAERASVYSSSGVVPVISTTANADRNDRNSYYATNKQTAGDGASVRSGLLAHGRNDSITNSIGGGAPTSPLASQPPVAP